MTEGPISLPPAYKHNDLFGPGNKTDLNACVGTNGGPYNLKDYAFGYWEAGKRLSSSVVADTWLVDVTVYPLVFIHRHAIELSLKHLLETVPVIFGQSATAPTTHRLIDSWNAVKMFLSRDVRFDPDGSHIQFVGDVLSDFLELDSNGEAFRYPWSRQGSAFLQDTAIINVAVFAKVMTRMGEIFEYWFDVVDSMTVV